MQSRLFGNDLYVLWFISALYILCMFWCWDVASSLRELYVKWPSLVHILWIYILIYFNLHSIYNTNTRPNHLKRENRSYRIISLFKGICTPFAQWNPGAVSVWILCSSNAQFRNAITWNLPNTFYSRTCNWHSSETIRENLI